MPFSFTEMMVVGVIAILLFGRDLPGVARTAGQHYAKFRKMLHDFSSQVNLNEIYDPNPTSYKGSHTAKRSPAIDYDDHDEATAPKFQPPPADDSTPANKA
jgi:sec-independent protein translocase protein TatA